MSSRKPSKSLKRSERPLFLAPLLVLGGAFLAQSLRQKLLPSSTPAPTRSPAKILWHDTSNRYERIIPSRDGKTIFTWGFPNGGQKVISSWDTKTGRMLHMFSDTRVLRSDALAISDDGSRVAYALDGGWNPATDPNGLTARTGIYDGLRGQRLRLIPTKSDFALPYFLPHSHHLFLGMSERFEIWDSDTGKLLKRRPLLAAKTNTFATAFSHALDKKKLAVIFSARVTPRGYCEGLRDEIGLFSTGAKGYPQTQRPERSFIWPRTLIQSAGFVNNGRQLLVLTTAYKLNKSPNANSDESDTFSNIVIDSTHTLRLLDCQTGREQLIDQSTAWQLPQIAISRDGQFIALTYTSITPQNPPYKASPTVSSSGNTTNSIGIGPYITYSAFINVYQARTRHKIASLWLARDVPDNTGMGYSRRVNAMAFAPNNSMLYYSDDETKLVTRWPRQNWKIGATQPAE